MGEQRSTGRGRRWRLGLASGCATALCIGMLPGASADGDDETFPSRERVRQAQERVDSTADRVAAIKAQLAAADERLESLTVAAGKASEAYNGALYKLQQARAAALRAQRHAEAATARVRQIQDQLSSAIVTTYENGGALTSLGVLIHDPDPDALMERLDAYHGVTGAMQSTLDRYESAQVVAGVMDKRAESALEAQQDATEAAEAAKEAAEAAVAEAQAALSSIAAEKQSLIEELARVQNISVELAAQRQHALARKAAQEAAEEAAQEAAEQAQQEQEAEEQAQEEQQAEEQAQEEQQAQQEQQADQDPPADNGDNGGNGGNHNGGNHNGGNGGNNGGNHNGGNGGNDDPPPPDNDPPPTDPDPNPSHGAHAAIRYAKAQLGEPYVYGASGPDSWDCSGLTMQSWAAAGEYLSHWSVAQYYETTPISFGDLRRGDLLFWGDSDDPDSIYHVAMYLGHGKMIQAPRPGRSVEIVSIYYWILPNFYTRV